jgi:histidinol-phosphate aminotransferase
MKGNILYLNTEKKLVSNYIENVQAYSPVSSRDRIVRDTKEMQKGSMPAPLKLDWNESTIPPSPVVKNALQDALEKEMNLLNWYPELYSKKLVSDLAIYTGRSTNEILVTNGSDDALELICKVFLDPGDHVLVPYPTYTHFVTYVQSRGAVLKKIETPDPFSPDITSIINNVTSATKLIYLVNPNNPTGVLIPEKQIRTLCSIVKDAIILVDEAYFEFSGESVSDLIDTFPNLIITRTMSKAWALAGLRVGYILTNHLTIMELAKVLNPKSVSTLAQVAASAALSDKEYMKRFVSEVEASKIILIDFFKRNNMTVHDSAANYIMVQHPKLETLLKEMENENIFVRDRSSFRNLPGFFRITIGNHWQTEDLISRLERVLDRI